MIGGKLWPVGRAIVALRILKRWRCRLFERCGSDRFARTALHDLDRKVEPYLPDGGVFVEAGANDGFRKSNTYFLERFRNWNGVLVEPIPVLAARCRKHRPRCQVYQCALVAPDHPTDEVVMTYADMMSEVALDGRPRPVSCWEWDKSYDVVVPTRTLTEVLSEAGVERVDFLSLDIQGLEAAALAGLDFDRWSPSIMLVEIVDDTAQAAVEAVLGSRYEYVARLSPHDVLYRIAASPNGR